MSSTGNGTSLPLTIEQGRESIVAVDARALERGCLVRVLRSEFVEYEIFEAKSAAELLRSAFGRPKLVILRIHPEQQPDEAIARDLEIIRRACPETFITLVCDDDERSLHYAFRHGCNGYLPTSMLLEIAVAALRLVLLGGLYFPQPIRPGEPTATALKSSPCAQPNERGSSRPDERAERAPAAPIFWEPASAGNDGEHPDLSSVIDASPGPAGQFIQGFTPREREVIDALQRGRSNKVIASDLRLSENTVKVHVRHIMRKLHATNRTQAALRSQLLFNAGQPIN